jgi:hypothetical protein
MQLVPILAPIPIALEGRRLFLTKRIRPLLVVRAVDRRRKLPSGIVLTCVLSRLGWLLPTILIEPVYLLPPQDFHTRSYGGVRCGLVDIIPHFNIKMCPRMKNQRIFIRALSACLSRSYNFADVCSRAFPISASCVVYQRLCDVCSASDGGSLKRASIRLHHSSTPVGSCTSPILSILVSSLFQHFSASPLRQASIDWANCLLSGVAANTFRRFVNDQTFR